MRKRQRKKYRGDFARLMCDRKSSRRHASKRESSSRSSESGSRSAEAAAPEVPIVLPDGKEFQGTAGSVFFWVFFLLFTCSAKVVLTSTEKLTR